MSPTSRRWLSAAQALLVGEGLFWTALGGLAVTGAPARSPVPPWVLVGLLFANAAVFLGLAVALRRPGRALLGAAGGWAILNFALSFTDEVGVLDLASAGLALAVAVAVAMAGRAA